MPFSIGENHRFLTTITSIGLCVYFTFFFFTNPPVYAFQLKDVGISFAIWRSEQAFTLRWVYTAAAVLLSAAALSLTVLCGRFLRTRPASWKLSAVASLAPLSLLPLACIPLFLSDMLAPAWSTNLRLFIVLGVLSLSVARLVSHLLECDALNTRHTVIWAWAVFLAAFAAYAHFGYHFSKTVGEHVGDEGHYLIQAQSLYEDRDLDIANQLLASLGEDDPARISRGRFHISPLSRGDALYSVHPYGLSLLLAPAWKWGLGGRHIVLGLISAAGLAGLFLTCRRMGAGNVASLLAVLSLGISVFWSVYSFRALPEVLAASLVIWTFWAIAVQHERPWTSLLIAAACCIFLPFAHTRFIPLSLMGIGLYGLFGLLGAQAWRGKLIRLATFTAVCAAGYGSYMAMQYAMFGASGNYPVKAAMFSYPMGVWEIFVNDRGLLSHFPVFFWLAGAMVAWCVVDRGNRWFCLGIAATFLAGLLTTASYPWYTGGSSLPGRYLIATTPLLFVGAAVMLERVNLAARTWFLFLSLFSAMILFLVWNHLPSIGRSFIMPMHALGSFPLLQDFYFPHASFRHGAKADIFWTNMYAVTGMIITLAIILLQKKRLFVSFLGILITLTFGIVVHNNFEYDRFSFLKHMQVLNIDDNNIIIVDRKRSLYSWNYKIDLHSMHSFTGRKNTIENINKISAYHDLDEKGLVAWGTYIKIFPGSFFARFELETGNCKNECKIATLDITENYGDSILEKKDILCKESFESLSLFFTTEKFTVVEPRVYYHGCGNITVRHISVQERID